MTKKAQSGSTKAQPPKYKVIVPELQIAFYLRLQEIRHKYLEEALASTVEGLDIGILDKELAELAGNEKLAKLAKYGIRGEVFFPVPYLLESNPHLLGYYRLLFGVSSKEFYDQGSFGVFKGMEEKGRITGRHEGLMGSLCASLIDTAWILLNHLDGVDKVIIKDLQLLTLGPQLRGSRNTVLGQTATAIVFNHIKALLGGYISEESERNIIIRNDSGRTVRIEFSSDPDIKLTEVLASGDRNLVAIEIKGGRDISNIHNRLGEAEKSHQKARNKGFHEFWTILAVDVDKEKAHKESPTTTRFFHIEHIVDTTHPQYHEFSDHLSSLLGIQIKPNLQVDKY
ncbi:MAG: XcyI family restriction endonuclease [Nitrospirae bacterium]|nr:XcyI family restriction endonuclease [Nitrospirota bacterium]